MKIDDSLRRFAKGEAKKETCLGGYAIIYCRVSTKEQVNGQSLEVQLEKCREYAEKKGLVVLEEFGGSYESAKSDKERKEFNRMLSFLRKKRKFSISAVIVYSTSRFSRTGSTTIVEEVEALGGVVLSATSNYDPRTATGKFAQNMELANARFNNDYNRNVIRESSIAALRKGRWIGKAPRGYNQVTTKAEQVITVNDEGKLIRQAFLWKANEKLTNEQIRLKLETLGFKINKQKLSELFRNPFYCGLLAHKFLEGELVEGNHPPLVSIEVFKKVNDILEKSHGSGYEQKVDKEYAPLLGTIKCPVCGKNLSASESTKMRKKFGRSVGYYVCSRKGCKYNTSTKKVHEAYEVLVGDYGLSNHLSYVLKMQMEKLLQTMNKGNREIMDSLKKRLVTKKREIEQVEFNYAMEADVKGRQICQKALTKLESEKMNIEREIEGANIEILNLSKYVDFGMKMRRNLFELWELSELAEKKRLQELIFPEGFIYDKNEEDIEPIKVNQFFLEKPRNSIVYDENEKRTNLEKSDLSLHVLEAGLEPAQPQWPRDFKSRFVCNFVLYFVVNIAA